MGATSCYVQKKLLHSSHPSPQGLPNLVSPLLQCYLSFSVGGVYYCPIWGWTTLVLYCLHLTSGDSLSAAKETALMSFESWTYRWHRMSIYKAIGNCITLAIWLSRFSDPLTSLVMNFWLGLQYQAWIASSWAGFKFSYTIVGCIQDINTTITLLQIFCLFCSWCGSAG